MVDSGAWNVKATESRVSQREKSCRTEAKVFVMEILALEAFECRPFHNRKSRLVST